VHAYPELVALAWRNLIGDAVRRARGAPITLTFGARPPEPDEDAAGPVLTFTIEGFTLSSDDARGLFTRTARLGEGAAASGLGLTVCRRIAERHAGWITVDVEAARLEFSLFLGATVDRIHSPG